MYLLRAASLIELLSDVLLVEPSRDGWKKDDRVGKVLVMLMYISCPRSFISPDNLVISRDRCSKAFRESFSPARVFSRNP